MKTNCDTTSETKKIKKIHEQNDDIAICTLSDTSINKAPMLCEQEGNASSYISKAKYAYEHDDKTVMLEYLNAAKDLIDETKDSALLEQYYSVCCLYYYSASDINTYLSYCLKALHVAEGLDNKLKIASHLMKIGKFYSTYECYDKALLYVHKALAYLDVKDMLQHAILVPLLGLQFDCQVHLGDYKEANRTLNKLAPCSNENRFYLFYLHRCFMIYHSYLHDVDATLDYAKELLYIDPIEFQKQDYTTDVLSCILQSMIRIEQKEYASKALLLLKCSSKNASQKDQLKMDQFQIEFESHFNKTNKIEDYKAYYSSYKEREVYLREEKVRIFKHKIFLHDRATREEIEHLNSLSQEDKHHLDPLTQLHTRQFLHTKIAEIVGSKKQRNICVILFDIDFFEEYNAYYGKESGNEVIKKVATLLKTYCMKHMHICRFDTDQFACVCHDCDKDSIKEYIEKVKLALYNLHIAHANSLCDSNITLSSAYAIHDLPIKEHIFSFLKDVEQALYHAKIKGRNKTVFLQYEEDPREDELIFVSKSDQVLQLTKDIKAIRFQDLDLLKQKCDSLATLAEKNNDLYGITFSHIYLAHYYQINQSDDDYKFHSEKAKELATTHQYYDVLAEYYKLAYIYFSEYGDELSAFSACLLGLEIAKKSADHNAYAAFKNNIAESFYQNGELDKAEYYFLKGLENTSTSTEFRPKYKDLLLMNIVDVFVQKKDLENAKYWLKKSQSYGYDSSLIATYSKRSEICILILDKRIEEALEKIEHLRIELESEETMLFIHIYLYLMDALLEIKQKEYASWCMHILLSISNDVNTQFQLQIYTLQIRYCELFQVNALDAYKKFYEISLTYTKNENDMYIDIANNLIQRWDSQKVQESTTTPTTARKLKYVDEITTLYNRNYFTKLLSKLILNNDIHNLGIMVLDIDYFKAYNNCYGYQKGNMLLSTIASSIVSIVSNNASIFRFCKDEFICVFVDKEDEELTSFIKEIQEQIQLQQIEHIGHKSNPHVTLSIGYYNGVDRNNALEHAEDALRKAKTIGRNTYFPQTFEKQTVQNYSFNECINRKERDIFLKKYTEVFHAPQHYALVQINIKNFRYYNTRYGYHEANNLLLLLYKAMKQWLLEGEYATHICADNFVALVRYDNIDTLLQDRLVKSIATLEQIKDPHIYRNLFLTYGIYELKDGFISFQDAWNAVNLVRKETSSSTKRESSLGLYNESYRDSFLARIQLEVDTATAYKNYEFIPFYQPKVDAITHEIIGAEALLRWYDSKGDLVPLYKFLPILNENGYIRNIDLSIFETTCKMLDERVKAGRPVVPISFNISKSYFYEDSIIEDYIRVFEMFDIPKELIELELMETISLDDSERLKKVVQGFNDYGFRCVLDDFGNGYSSFNVLLNNQLSTVKIDRQFFVKNLNGDNKLIIKTVINLIKSLHMNVVAEGVETKEYADYLAECGCDAIQGFYFYKPMPLKKFYTLINRAKADEVKLM